MEREGERSIVPVQEIPTAVRTVIVEDLSDRLKDLNVKLKKRSTLVKTKKCMKMLMRNFLFAAAFEIEDFDVERYSSYAGKEVGFLQACCSCIRCDFKPKFVVRRKAGGIEIV